MQKILKIVFILLVVFGVFVCYVQASDIDLNLPNNDNATADNNDTLPDDNTTTNPPVNDDDNNDDEQNMTSTGNTIISTPNDNIGTTETLHPNTVSNSPETGLGIGNIINILLITVGVIIILLAIAIIIRLKG